MIEDGPNGTRVCDRISGFECTGQWQKAYFGGTNIEETEDGMTTTVSCKGKGKLDICEQANSITQRNQYGCTRQCTRINGFECETWNINLSPTDRCIDHKI